MLTKEGLNQVKEWTDIINRDAPDEIKNAEVTPRGTAACAQWLVENGHCEGYTPFAVNVLLAAAVFDAASMGLLPWDEVLDALNDAK